MEKKFNENNNEYWQFHNVYIYKMYLELQILRLRFDYRHSTSGLQTGVDKK